MRQKKMISLLLTLAFLLCCLPTAALAGPNTNYELTGRGQDDVVAVAKAQLGRTGRDLGYTYEWCAAFVTWAGRTAGQDYPAGDLYTPLAGPSTVSGTPPTRHSSPARPVQTLSSRPAAAWRL